MIAAGPGQRPGELVRRPDRDELERVAERRAADRGRAGRAGHDDPGTSRTPDSADRLRAGVAQLVDEVLDARTRRSGRGRR